MIRIYLAGPCTGLPEFNYPAFHAEAARLRQLGYHVENPAENAAPACGTWAGYMRLALAQLVTCETIALLPGWLASRGANLSDAYLSGANLSDAYLRGANLSELSSIWGLTGNLREVKAIQADIWPVTYTATHMQIGCQLHALTEWWAFNDEDISRMDSKALAWWSVWKPILQQIIEASPAVPGGERPAETEAA